MISSDTAYSNHSLLIFNYIHSFICLHCTVVYTLSICLRYKRLIQHQYPAINQIQNLKNIDQLLAVRSVKTSN